LNETYIHIYLIDGVFLPVQSASNQHQNKWLRISQAGGMKWFMFAFEKFALAISLLCLAGLMLFVV